MGEDEVEANEQVESVPNVEKPKAQKPEKVVIAAPIKPEAPKTKGGKKFELDTLQTKIVAINDKEKTAPALLVECNGKAKGFVAFFDRSFTDKLYPSQSSIAVSGKSAKTIRRTGDNLRYFTPSQPEIEGIDAHIQQPKNFPAGKKPVHLLWVKTKKDENENEVEVELAKIEELFKNTNEQIKAMAAADGVGELGPHSLLGGENRHRIPQDYRPSRSTKGITDEYIARYPYLQLANRYLNPDEILEFRKNQRRFISLKSGSWSSSRLTTELVSAEASATIHSDGSFTIHLGDTTSIESTSAVVVSKQGDIIGLVSFPNILQPSTWLTRSYHSLVKNLEFSIENPSLKLALSNTSFESQSVKAIFTANVNLSSAYSDAKLTIEPASSAEIITRDSNKILEGRRIRRRTVSDKQPFVFEHTLPIRGKQGTFKFLGQFSAKGISEFYSPIFEFTVSRYKSREDKFTTTSNWINIDNPIGNPNLHSIVKTEGKILSTARGLRGKVLCVHTDAPSIQFFDPESKQMSSRHQIPIRENAMVTAGDAGLFVYYANDSVIEKWSLETHEKLASKILRLEGKVIGWAAPEMNAEAPVFMVTEETVYFIDPETLRIVKADFSESVPDKDWERRLKEKKYRPIVRASGDGRVYLFTTPGDDIKKSRTIEFRRNPSTTTISFVTGHCVALGANSVRYSHSEGYGKKSKPFSNFTSPFPDPCHSGLIAGLQRVSTYYLPPMLNHLDIYIDSSYGYGPSRKTGKLLSLGAIAEFGANKSGNGGGEVSIWDRGILMASYGVFIAISEDQSQLSVYHHDLTALQKKYNKGEAQLISGFPKSLNPGEELLTSLDTTGDVSDIVLINGPEGSSIENGILRWKANGDQAKAPFSIELVSGAGESRVFDLSIDIDSASGAELKIGSSQSTALLGRNVSLKGTPLRAFKGGSGRFLCVLYTDQAVLDVFDIKAKRLHFSAFFDGNDLRGTANHHSVYLYSAEKKMLQRVSLLNPSDQNHRKFTTSLVGMGGGSHSGAELLIFEYIEGEILARDTMVINNRRVTTTSRGKSTYLHDILNPTTLESKSFEYKDSVKEFVNSAAGSFTRKFKILPTTPKGDVILFGKGRFRIENGKFITSSLSSTIDSRTESSSLNSTGTHIFAYSKVRDLESKNTQYMFKRRGYYKALSIPGIYCFKNKGKVEFCKEGENDEPFATITMLPSLSWAYDKNGSLPQPQSIFYSSPHKTLIKVSCASSEKDFRLHFFDFDLEAISDN